MKEHQDETKLIFILSLVQFAHILDFVLMMPLGPTLIRALHLNPSQLGWLVSSYTFAAALSGILVSRFLDKFDRKNSLLLFCFLFAVATTACAFSTSLESLLLFRVLSGASGGVLQGMLLAILGDQIPEMRRGAAIGKVMSSFAIASVFGIPTSLYLASRWGWHFPFLVLGFVSFGIVVVLYKWLSLKKKMNGSATQAPQASHLSKKQLILGLSSSFFLMFASFSVVPYVSISLVTNAGVKEESLFIVYFIAGTLSFFATRSVGKMSDLFGKMKTFKAIVFCSVFSTWFITSLASVGLVVASIATAFFMVCNSSRNVPQTSLLVSKFPAPWRGKYMSLNASTQQIASGIGSAFSSQLIVTNDVGQLKGFFLVGVISVTAALVSVILLNQFESCPWIVDIKNKEWVV